MPCMCVLPMGWSWSLHYCQLAVRNVVEQALGPSRIVEDRQGGIVLSRSLPIAGAAYEDNFAVFGLSSNAVDSELNAFVDGFGKLGLPVYKITPASTHSYFVGLDVNRGLVSLKPSQLWKLRSAVRAVLRRRATSGDALRVIAGRLTWAMMAKRELPSILNAVYVPSHHWLWVSNWRFVICGSARVVASVCRPPSTTDGCSCRVG